MFGRSCVAVLLHIGEGPAHDDGELVDVSRLESGEPVLRQADQRLGDRLMRAAFGASVMPDGVATTMKRASW